jgi:hypothetical protein
MLLTALARDRDTPERFQIQKLGERLIHLRDIGMDHACITTLRLINVSTATLVRESCITLNGRGKYSASNACFDAPD